MRLGAEATSFDDPMPLCSTRIRHILERELSGTVIVVSHEVNPEYREYEQTSTIVVNCLLIPVVSRYLERIEEKLRSKISLMLYKGDTLCIETLGGGGYGNPEERGA